MDLRALIGAPDVERRSDAVAAVAVAAGPADERHVVPNPERVSLEVRVPWQRRRCRNRDEQHEGCAAAIARDLGLPRSTVYHLLAAKGISDSVLNPDFMVEVFNTTVRGLRG